MRSPRRDKFQSVEYVFYVVAVTYDSYLPPCFAGFHLCGQWQAGAISALQERYDLSSLDFVGASAGALAATLAACDADMDVAMTLALELCDTNQARMIKGSQSRMAVPTSSRMIPGGDERRRFRA